MASYALRNRIYALFYRDQFLIEQRRVFRSLCPLQHFLPISFARFSIEINGYLSLAKLFLKCNFHEEEKYLGQPHVSTKLLSSVVFKMFRGKMVGGKYAEDGIT